MTRGNNQLRVVAVLLSLVLWLIVLGSRNVELVLDVPLTYELPKDLLPSEELPQVVQIRLVGPKAFLRNIGDEKHETIHVPFGQAKVGVNQYRLFADSLNLPLGVKISSIQPAQVKVKFEENKSKEVPVRISTFGALPDGFKADRTEIKPGYIRISGPESLVHSTNEVYTAPLDLGVLLPNEWGLAKIQPTNPLLSVPEIHGFAVRVVVSGVSPTFRVATIPVENTDQKVTVYFKEEKTKINPADFKAVLESSDGKLVNRTQGVHPIKVTVPTGFSNSVKILKLVPSSIFTVLKN